MPRDKSVADDFKCLVMIDGANETDVKKTFRKYILKKVGAAHYYSWFSQGVFEENQNKLEFKPSNELAARVWSESYPWISDANSYLNDVLLKAKSPHT